MKIINVLLKTDLTGLKIFNPNNLLVKKAFIYKNRAIVIHPDAQRFGSKGNKIVIDGEVYKFCNQCSRFFLLSDFPRRKYTSDGLDPHCRECAKVLASLKYLQNKDYYLWKSREQYFRTLEKKGFPKDRRRIGNRMPSPPKHWHPWSRPWLWSEKTNG